MSQRGENKKNVYKCYVLETKNMPQNWKSMENFVTSKVVVLERLFPIMYSDNNSDAGSDMIWGDEEPVYDELSGF
jgi:hypothetical protein